MAIYRGNGGSLDGLVESEVILLAISQGGTGSSTASGARTNLGLGSAAATDSSAYATAAQGAKADTAVQSADLATVATTGDYDDLSNKPTVPTNLDSLTDVVITSATNGQGLQFNGTNWVNSNAGSGTVTSVDMSVPTGLAVSGNPVTTSGTLAVTYASGYSIPTTANQTNWSTAYGWGNHASAGYLTSETYTGTVTSVAMTVPTGLSVSGTPITSSGTLAVTLTAGYSIPTTSSQTNWDTAYTDRLKWDGGATGLTASTGRTSLGATTVGSNLFTLTNPSAITFVRLNADNTVSALSASAFRTAIGANTTGTVTSVNMTVPTGLSVSGNPVTSSGTLAVTFSAGYSIPTTANQTNWSTAYGWGNHASAGYLTSSSTLDASKLSGTIDGGTY
jgi:Ni,Fe-hydrogenase III small subunit